MSRYNIIKPSKEEILASYSKYGVSISSLAKKYNTSNPTVRKWLIEYGIDRKSQKQASTEANNINKKVAKPSRQDLIKMYETMSIKTLEKLFGVSQQTIYEWFEEYEIQMKTHSEACVEGKRKQLKKYTDMDLKFFNDNYDFTKPLSYNAEQLDISVSFLKSKLKEYDIKIEPTWRSKAEIELYDYCVENFPQYDWVYCDKSVINPYELDIVNKDKKIAIEYCGLYWHSETFGEKSKKYHYDKMKLCKEKGYKLITVFETDDIDIIKSLIKTSIGENKKIYARNTEIKTISSAEAKKFMWENHISGFVGALYHYGLFHKEEMVMVTSFGKSRYDKNYEYEIIRMSSKKGYTVIGGASKIFKNFIKEVNPSSCYTFSDLRFGQGNVYLNCGFQYAQETEPNFWYFNKNKPDNLYSRVKFQKHKLSEILDNYNPELTEYQNMLINSWDRIWDCGNNKYVYKK